MNRRDRLAWGLVGALAFLVLIQAYELAAGRRVGTPAKLGVALMVGLLTVWLIGIAGRRLGPNGSA